MDEILQKKQTEKASLKLATTLRKSQHKEKLTRKLLDNSLIQLRETNGQKRYVFDEATLPEALKLPKYTEFNSLHTLREELAAKDKEKQLINRKLDSLPKISLINPNSKVGEAEAGVSKYYKATRKYNESSDSLNTADNEPEELKESSLEDDVEPVKDVETDVKLDLGITNSKGVKFGAFGKIKYKDDMSLESQADPSVKVLLVGKSSHIVKKVSAAKDGHTRAVVHTIGDSSTKRLRSEPVAERKMVAKSNQFVSKDYHRVLSSNSLLYNNADIAEDFSKSPTPTQNEEKSPSHLQVETARQECQIHSIDEVEGLTAKYAIYNEIFYRKIEADLKFGYEFDLSNIKVDKAEVESLLVQQTEFAEVRSPSSTLAIPVQLQRQAAPKSVTMPVKNLMPVQELDDNVENSIDGKNSDSSRIENNLDENSDERKPANKKPAVKFQSQIHISVYDDKQSDDSADYDEALCGNEKDASEWETIDFEIVPMSQRKLLHSRKTIKPTLPNRLLGKKEKPILMPSLYEIVTHYFNDASQQWENAALSKPRYAAELLENDIVAGRSSAYIDSDVIDSTNAEPLVSDESEIAQGKLEISGRNVLERANNENFIEFERPSWEPNVSLAKQASAPSGFSSKQGGNSTLFDLDIDEFLKNWNKSNPSASQSGFEKIVKAVLTNKANSEKETGTLKENTTEKPNDSVERDTQDQSEDETANYNSLIKLQQAKQKDVLSLLDKSVLMQMKASQASPKTTQRSLRDHVSSPKKKVQELKSLLQKAAPGAPNSSEKNGRVTFSDEKNCDPGSANTNSDQLGSDAAGQLQQQDNLLNELFAEKTLQDLCNVTSPAFSCWPNVLALAKNPKNDNEVSAALTTTSSDESGASSTVNESLLTASSITPQLSASSAQEFVDAAIDLIRKENYDRAMVKLTLAIQSDSSLRIAYWLRSQLYLQVNNIEAAANDLDKLCEMVRTNPAVFWLRARLSEMQNRVKQAIQGYSAVTRLSPDSVGAFLRRALLYEREGNRVSANEDLRNVRVLEPNNAYAILNEADTCFQKTLWEDAIVSYTRLLRLEPNNAHAYANRGRAFSHLQRFEDGLRDLNNAITCCISVNVNSDQITSNVDNITLAECYYYRGTLTKIRNPKRALEDLSTALLLIRDSPAMAAKLCKQRASIYLSKGNIANALRDYHDATVYDSYNCDAFACLGDVYMQHLQDYKSALSAYDKCLDINPTDVRTLMKRADVHERLHQIEKCESSDSGFAGNVFGGRVALMPFLDFMEEANNVEDALKNAKLSLKASIKEQQQGQAAVPLKPTAKRRAANHLDLAIRDYSIVIHLCPNNDSVYLHRGRLLLQKNFIVESSHDFSSAFAINDSMAVTFSQKALVLLFQQKYQQIIDEFHLENTTADTMDETVWRLLAKAKSRLNDFSGAIQALKQAAAINPNDPATYLESGICNYKLGNVEQTFTDLNKSLKLRPAFAKALYYRGLYRLGERHGERYGIQDINKAIKIDPLFFDAYIARAAYLYKKRKYDEAIQDCHMALQLEPSSVRALLLRGCSYFYLKDNDTAIANFTRALHVSPDSHQAIFNRAIAHTFRGNFWKAISDYSIALWCKPHVGSYLNRGLLYWKLGNFENATIDFNLARDLNPSDIQMEILLGMCLLKINRIPDSVDAFARAIALAPLAKEAYIGRSMTFLAVGNVTDAVKDLENVIHYYPRDVSAYTSLLHICQSERQYSYAFKLISSVLQWTLDKAAAFENRALLFLGTGKFLEAAADIDRAILIERSNNGLGDAESDTFVGVDPVKLKSLADYYVNSGVIAEKLGDLAQAMKSYKMALSLDSSHVLASCNMATMYVRQRMFEKAIDLLTKAISTSLLKAPSLYLLRATAYSLQGNSTLAVADLEQVLLLDPSNTIALFNRANINQSLKKFAEAEEDYRKLLQTDPTDKLVLFKQGQCQLYSNKDQQAFETWGSIKVDI